MTKLPDHVLLTHDLDTLLGCRLQVDELNGQLSERHDIGVAVANALERVLGPNQLHDEPRLSAMGYDKSDMIFGLDFGDGLNTQVNIPLKGRIMMDNPIIEALFHRSLHYFREELNRLFVEDADLIIRERF